MYTLEIWDFCDYLDTELPTADLELPRTGFRSFSLRSWVLQWFEEEDLYLEYVSYLSVADTLLLLLVLRRGLLLFWPCRLDFSRFSSLLMLWLWYLLRLREDSVPLSDRRDTRSGIHLSCFRPWSSPRGSSSDHLHGARCPGCGLSHPYHAKSSSVSIVVNFQFSLSSNLESVRPIVLLKQANIQHPSPYPCLN